MKIVVDTARMRAAGAGIRSTAAALRNNMDMIMLLVDGLDGDWQGEAARTYAARMACMYREYRELERFFSESAAYLTRFSEEYARCEDELAAKITNV